MCNKYENHWLERVNLGTKSGNKLRMYCQFKKHFYMENYILSIPALNKRKNFTKLRISAQQLQSELGRYTRTKTPLDERICQQCTSSLVEDDYHFLTCPKYLTERKEFFDKVNFTTLNTFPPR